MDINWNICRFLNWKGQTSISGDSKVDKLEPAQKICIDVEDDNNVEWLSVWLCSSSTYTF